MNWRNGFRVRDDEGAIILIMGILIFVAWVYFALILLCIYFGQKVGEQKKQIDLLLAEKAKDNFDFVEKVKNFESILTKMKKQISVLSEEKELLTNHYAVNINVLKDKNKTLQKQNDSLLDNIALAENKKRVSEADLRYQEQEYKKLKISYETLESKSKLLEKSLHEAPLGFPSLIELLKEYDKMQDEKTAHSLETKSRPAFTAAETVREETRKRRNAEYECCQAKLLLDYYCSISPDLQEGRELLTEEIDPVEIPSQNENEDVAERYLSREEYQKLSTTERNQLALDRFWNRPKSKLLIGRLYEQYVGYLYEKDGWIVEYYGISEGLSDRGRDLICKKDNTTLIIQCKNWSKLKTIYEKHLFQLFGTTFDYAENNPFEDVRGVFYTATALSDFARSFAKKFNIELHENFELKKFPIIKCNIGREGEKIYHLPFDQQYYNTKINPKDGDFYCSNVAEAEELGFRRAYRWHGEFETY